MAFVYVKRSRRGTVWVSRISWPARRCHQTSKSATGKQPSKNASAGNDASKARRQGSGLSGCAVALGVGITTFVREAFLLAVSVLANLVRQRGDQRHHFGAFHPPRRQ